VTTRAADRGDAAEVAASPTAGFFDELAERRHDARLEKGDGTLRFDLDADGRDESWVVAIEHGDVTVAGAGSDVPATCTVRVSRALFDEIAAGRKNLTAAVLRGELAVEGDIRLLLLFQRVLPGPPGGVHPRARAGSSRSAP
jgi:putative sterol carrier protein